MRKDWPTEEVVNVLIAHGTCSANIQLARESGQSPPPVWTRVMELLEEREQRAAANSTRWQAAGRGCRAPSATRQ